MTPLGQSKPSLADPLAALVKTVWLCPTCETIYESEITECGQREPFDCRDTPILAASGFGRHDDGLTRPGRAAVLQPLRRSADCARPIADRHWKREDSRA